MILVTFWPEDKICEETWALRVPERRYNALEALSEGDPTGTLLFSLEKLVKEKTDYRELKRPDLIKFHGKTDNITEEGRVENINILQLVKSPNILFHGIQLHST